MVEAAGLVGLMWTSGGTVVVDVAAQGVFQGTYTASQIQALGGIPLTTTAPASTALGPYWWSFDGVDDSMALSGPLFQPSDDWCVIAGANSNSASGYPMIFSHSDAAGISKANLFFNQGKPCVEVAGTGGTVGPMYGSVRINETLIISGRKAALILTGRLNGVSFGTASTSALTLLPVTSAAIGCLPITAPGLFWQGAIYPIIAVKGTVTDADLLTFERLVGNLSGVSIP
jgi:hypothetical protein